MSMALAGIFIMTACGSPAGNDLVETQSANTLACAGGVRPGMVLNIREGINGQDEDEARQVITAINGAGVPLTEYLTKNQYSQFSFVVWRGGQGPDGGLYPNDVLQPGPGPGGLVDVGYIAYNQYGTSWFKKRTCDTLLAAGKRGVHLLLVGDHLADIDPTSPDAGPAFQACISELTHLVPLAPNTAAPTTVTGLLGGAASQPVAYLDALRTSALFSPTLDVTAATAPVAAATTPVAVAFERTPDGARTIAMNFRPSRAETADGRQKLTEGLTAAMVALRGCSRDIFTPDQCTVGTTRNERKLQTPNGRDVDCNYVGDLCSRNSQGVAAWQYVSFGDGQCTEPGGDLDVYRYFNSGDPNPRRNYIYVPVATGALPPYIAAYDLDGTVGGGRGKPLFRAWSAPFPDSVEIHSCNHYELDPEGKPKYYLAPSSADGGPACQGGVDEGIKFYCISHKFRGGFRLVHILNVDRDGGGKFHAIEDGANKGQIHDLRDTGIDGVGHFSDTKIWEDNFRTVYFPSAN